MGPWIQENLWDSGAVSHIPARKFWLDFTHYKYKQGTLLAQLVLCVLCMTLAQHLQSLCQSLFLSNLCQKVLVKMCLPVWSLWNVWNQCKFQPLSVNSDTFLQTSIIFQYKMLQFTCDNHIFQTNVTVKESHTASGNQGHFSVFGGHLKIISMSRFDTTFLCLLVASVMHIKRLPLATEH